MFVCIYMYYVSMYVSMYVPKLLTEFGTLHQQTCHVYSVGHWVITYFFFNW